MQKLFATLLSVIALSFFTVPAGADEYVHGYYRSDGTYVQPYYRTSPDGNPYNNYSTKGNINPYTGQPGTKNPYPAYQYQTPTYQPYTYQPYVSPYTPPPSNPYAPPPNPYSSPNTDDDGQ